MKKNRKLIFLTALLLLSMLLSACNTQGGSTVGTTAEPSAEAPTTTQPIEDDSPKVELPADKTLTQGIVGEIKGGERKYQAWPSVCSDEDGVLYAVASGYRAGHICPFGKDVMYISRDGGQTWSTPYLINDTVMDDRDCGILYLGEGKMLISWFHNAPEYYYNYYEKNPSQLTSQVQAILNQWKQLPAEEQRNGGSYVMLSEDYGVTWQEPVRVPISAPHGPTLLSDGRLLYAGNEHFATDGGGYLSGIKVYESSDNGKTWTASGSITAPRANTFEPHVAELADGSILCAIRAHTNGKDSGKDLTIYLSKSTNGGKSWTVAKATGWCGSPPHILVHSSGAVILTYGFRGVDGDNAYGVRARVSYDNGSTWSDEIILSNNSPSGDCGYPCSAELPNGAIVTVYYQAIAKGEPCSILYTRWWHTEEAKQG